MSKRASPKLLSMVRVCPGRRHAIWKTTAGEIRKELALPIPDLPNAARKASAGPCG